MHRNPLIYVIILSYNGCKYIVNLLDSIYQSSYDNYNVLLVDNNSEDNTPVLAKTHFPKCKVTVNKSNLGFAAGCNVGLQKAIENNAEYIFILNQDCLVQKNTLINLFTSAQNKPSAGVLGPKTWFFNSSKESKPRILYAGAWRFILPLVQRVRGIGRYDDGQYDRGVPVDYVWGHGMFLRASALQVLGLFDPDFFMYYEDIDLCYRMKKSGFQIWYEPSAVVWHDVPDAARGSNSEIWRWENKCRSAHTFHLKHAPKWATFILDSATFTVEILRRLWAGHLQAATHILQTWMKIAGKNGKSMSSH